MDETVNFQENMQQQISDLVALSNNKRSDVRTLAANALAGMTLSRENHPLFLHNDGYAVKSLMDLVSGNAQIDVIKCLINLSQYQEFAVIMAHEEFMSRILLLVLLPKTIYADLLCMLLNNLSKFELIIRLLVPENEDSKYTSVLDNLIQVFAVGKSFNVNADYNFLSGLLANLSTLRIGSDFMVGKSKVDGEWRLSKMIAFIGHESHIRRGGVLSVIKNCCFDTTIHHWILSDQELNLLPFILLPLAGPEDLTEEEYDGLPDELLFLESDKKRESDPKIRLLLVEILLLLATTQTCREILRKRKVYTIIQKCHLVETDDQVLDIIDRIVQFLVRDEQDIQVGIEEI